MVDCRFAPNPPYVFHAIKQESQVRLISIVLLNILATGMAVWVASYDFCAIKNSASFRGQIDEWLIVIAIIFQLLFFVILFGLINSIFNYFFLVNAFCVGVGRRAGLYLALFILFLCSISMVLSGSIGESNKLEKSRLMGDLFNHCYCNFAVW